MNRCCSEWPLRRKMPKGSRFRICWRKACPPFPPPQLHPVKFAASSRACRSLQTFHCCCLVTKSCPTLCNPMDCSPLGSSVLGILHERILEWFSISFSRDLPDAGIEPCLLHWQAGSLPLNHLGSSIFKGLSAFNITQCRF